jgi:hypothetical protein
MGQWVFTYAMHTAHATPNATLTWFPGAFPKTYMGDKGVGAPYQVFLDDDGTWTFTPDTCATCFPGYKTANAAKAAAEKHWAER